MLNPQGGWKHPGKRSSDYSKNRDHDHDRRTYASAEYNKGVPMLSNKNLPERRRKFDPWFSFQDEMKDLINRFSDSEDWNLTAPTQFIPKVDVIDKGKNYLVTAEIPGMKEEDINVSLYDNVLTIEGEKKSETKEEGKGFFKSEISYGSFYRAVPLEEDVDETKCDATYKDGVLKITLDKKEGVENRAKKIAVGKGKESLEQKAKH